MGQASQPGCQADCGCSAQPEVVLGPAYPQPRSCMIPSGTLQTLVDWQDELPCHCGLEEDAEDMSMQPIYPELGSYVCKREVPAQRPKALLQHLDELTQLSQELGNLKMQEMILYGNTSRSTEDSRFCQLRDSQRLEQKLEHSKLLNFTPQFLSSVPGSRACQYLPSTFDEIDVEVKRNLDALDETVSRELCIRRKKVGVYEVDGRKVMIYWRGLKGTFAHGSEDLYVHEDAVGISDADDMPLPLYLQQVANVLLSTQKVGVGSSIAANMTFADVGTDLAQMKHGRSPVDRDQAMRMACSQAQQRKAACQEQFQFGLNGMALKL